MQKKNLYNKYKKKSKNFLSIINITTGIGFFYLRTLENIFLTKSNFESIRRLLSRKVKKKVNFVFFKNSNKLPTFKKPLKIRMGSGKAAFNVWLWKFQKFQKIFEISFYKKQFLIKKYLNKLKNKLPCKSFLTIRN